MIDPDKAYREITKVNRLNDHPIMKFMLTLAECVKPFRGMRDLPDANCAGCKVTVGKTQKRGLILFQFLARGGKRINIEIDMSEAKKDPVQYFQSIYEDIQEALTHAKKESRIIVPMFSGKSNATG